MKSELTADEVRDLMSYDPSTGDFVRIKLRPGPNGQAGRKCGSIDRYGYLLLSINGRRYSAARVAWLYTYGEWPKHHIDHIDGDKTNNRIANLRDVPNSVNAQNVRAPNKRNQLGVLGVSLHGRKYVAHLGLDGVRHKLGVFDTQDQAQKAYVEAKRKLHIGCTI